MELKLDKAQPEEIRILTDLYNKALEFKRAHGDDAWGEGAFTEDEVSGMVGSGTLYTIHNPDNDEIVGATMLQWSDEKIWGEQPDDAGYVHHLAVNEDSHGQGVGAHTLDLAAEEVRRQGRKYLRLDCRADNESLCGRYEQVGFERVGTIDNPSNPDVKTALYQREA